MKMTFSCFSPDCQKKTAQQNKKVAIVSIVPKVAKAVKIENSNIWHNKKSVENKKVFLLFFQQL